MMRIRPIGASFQDMLTVMQNFVFKRYDVTRHVRRKISYFDYRNAGDNRTKHLRTLKDLKQLIPVSRNCVNVKSGATRIEGFQ